MRFFYPKSPRNLYWSLYRKCYNVLMFKKFTVAFITLILLVTMMMATDSLLGLEGWAFAFLGTPLMGIYFLFVLINTTKLISQKPSTLTTWSQAWRDLYSIIIFIVLIWTLFVLAPYTVKLIVTIF